MKLDLDTFLRSSEPILPFEAGEDNDDLIQNGMNFDITARLKKLFNYIRGPSSQDLETDPAEHIANTLNGGGSNTNTNFPTSFLKRKAAEKENSDYQVLTKYRKIDTEFPKVIPKPFEDDTKLILNDKKKKLQLGKPTTSMPAQNRHHQYHRGRKQHIDPGLEAHYRQCKLPAPKLVTMRTTFADCEFSDDDMDELKVPKFNPKMFKKPPPPLIQKKTGGILASSIIPNLNPIRKVLTASSSNSSLNRAKEASKSRTWDSIFRENNSVSSSRYAPSQKNSILSEDHQTKEAFDYLQLLQKLEPSLYRTSNPKTSEKLSSLVSNRKSLSSSSNATVDLTRSRKIPLLHSRNFSSSVVTLEESDGEEVTEIIELDEDDEKLVSVFDKYKSEYVIEPTFLKKEKTLPIVEPVNSLQDKINLSPIVKEDNWLSSIRGKFKHEELHKQIKEAEEETRRCSQESTLAERLTQEKLKNLHIFDPECIVIDDFSEPEEEEEEPFPELDEHFIDKCINASSNETLISKFNIQIARRDIATLLGKNWLNDEVINFYMNLLMERGEQRNGEGYPKVYAMNTFFVPRIMQSGHSGVKRWTRRVDIFSHDVIPVPVHVGGVHWCMAIIHLKNKTIKYYDSMGTPNSKVLIALENYLKEESLDKKKQPFDTTQFTIENVADCPRQNNGSDCGVFSCMFAEYTCRNKDITFTQENMDYFRRKMIQEICTGKLLL